MSITAATSQVIPTMLEQVNPKLSYFLTQKRSAFANMFDKANEKHQISAWAAGTVGSGGVLGWRIPVLLSNGGDYQAISLDGGDLGTGSMQNTSFMTIGPYETDIAYNVPTRAFMSTKTDKQAIADALKQAVGNAIQETALYDEIGLFQSGDGSLATATAVSTTTGTAGTTITYTLDDNISYVRLRGYKQLLDIADSGGVIRSTGARIASIDYAANTVAVVVGTTFTASATDQLIFPGMGPVTSTTISSGTWRYGIYTYNTTSTSGSLLGLAYSTAYELACPKVNLQGGYISPTSIYSGKTQLIQRRDDSVTNGLIGVCHMAQRAAWYLQGLNIANQYIRSGEKAQNVDLAGQGTKYGDTFEAGDVTHHVSRYAIKNRIDWMVPKNFGKVQYQDTQFFTTPEGQRMFVGRSATTGNPQAGTQFYAVGTHNLYSVDPGCSCVFYGAAIPTGN